MAYTTSIRRGDKVTITCSVKTEKGDEVIAYPKKNPLSLTIGKNTLPPLIEKKLIGCHVHDKIVIELPPEHGYGLYDDTPPITLDRKSFDADFSAELWDELSIESTNSSKKDTMPAWVTASDEHSVTLSPSHPLAGLILTFTIHILTHTPAHL
mgnify:CR=1 FL=1